MKSIDVDMPNFTITVSDGGNVERVITDCGFGKHEGPNNLTPALAGAKLSSWKRDKNYRSSTYPKPNGGARMPYSLFLHQKPAIAFHEGDPFVESHGCIHLNDDDAAWLFAWAGNDPVDVDIRGPHPKPGVRAQVYLVGAGNMLPRVLDAISGVLVNGGFLPAAQQTYDDVMKAAVEAYQTQHGLEVDGKVGSETALHMGVER